MLMVERTVRHIYGRLLQDVKMPRKGQTVYISDPYQGGIGIWWTERKSDEGKRLYNVGPPRADGSQPPLFSM